MHARTDGQRHEKGNELRRNARTAAISPSDHERKTDVVRGPLVCSTHSQLPVFQTPLYDRNMSQKPPAEQRGLTTLRRSEQEGGGEASGMF